MFINRFNPQALNCQHVYSRDSPDLHILAQKAHKYKHSMGLGVERHSSAFCHIHCDQRTKRISRRWYRRCSLMVSFLGDWMLIIGQNRSDRETKSVSRSVGRSVSNDILTAGRWEGMTTAAMIGDRSMGGRHKVCQPNFILYTTSHKLYGLHCTTKRNISRSEMPRSRTTL